MSPFNSDGELSQQFSDEMNNILNAAALEIFRLISTTPAPLPRTEQVALKFLACNSLELSLTLIFLKESLDRVGSLS